MSENDYFKKSLSDFAFDAACGGAIRHLTDLSYSAEEIHNKLDFPVSIEKIKTTMTRYLIQKGDLLLTEPDNDEPARYEFVCEQDKYGRTSFRKVKKTELQKSNSEYVECFFIQKGKIREELLERLNSSQIAYLNSIDWRMGIRYHILNEKMKEILTKIEKD